MKVTIYNYREFDEKIWFDKYSKELNLELVICCDAPTINNAILAKGSECINIITSKIPEELVQRFQEYGVKYIATRTIGYDHIDIEACRKYGIRIGNALYGPEGVADYTLLLILSSIRNMKRIVERTNIQDYSLKGLQGRELKDLTIGVIGTGRIGQTVIRNLAGFGCKILANDISICEEVKQKATYVTLDEIWKKADLITIHTPLTDENFYLINKKTIDNMKDGVVIINTARGGLIDSQALIAGIESGKIGAAGLDVVENEFGLYYNDKKSDILVNRELAILRGFPNVIITHHMAFYTNNAIQTMVKDSLQCCKRFMDGLSNPWEID
ncbi:MAG TPA: D-isomer specific 2-hydroxyacid dehydrogenase family protein [Lachnospiraceae bacterium]|nr:D-isomer specific 2-hydroxyacid dehydrogenase family protein [Lachnospiraceae bacterium]